MGMNLYNNGTYNTQARYNAVTIYVGNSKMKEVKGSETVDSSVEQSGYTIKALMQDEFKFGLKANWEQILKAGGFSSTIETAMLVLGERVQNAGGITKQYYMGSEHIPVSVKFRIYDGGSGLNDSTLTDDPLFAVSILSRLCLPADGASIESFLEHGKNALTKAVDLAGNAISGVANGEDLMKVLNDFFSHLTGDVGNEVCFVTFGKWLSGFFVVKSVDFTYSKEVSVTGSPYYVDFDVQFESLMIPTKASVDPTDAVSQGKRTMFNIGKAAKSRVSVK